MLLEQLAKKEYLNVDFHNHLQTGSSLRTNEKPKSFKEAFRNLFLEEGFSSLTGILDRVMETPLDVVHITNFADSRLEDWTSEQQLKLAVQAGYQIEQGQYYTFAKKGKNGRVIALGKSQEVPTLQGHMLFAGIRRNKRFTNGKSLDETLAEANDDELKISDHSYAGLKGQNGIMAVSKSPEEDTKKVDALERNGNFSLPFSFANYKAVKYSRQYNKPLIANSDGHHPRDIGHTYNIFKSKDLIYISERVFRDSINYAVRNNNFDYHFTPIPPWRIFHHVMMIGVHYILDKMGKYKNKQKVIKKQ